MILSYFTSAGWQSWDVKHRPVIPEGMPFLIDDDLLLEDGPAAPRQASVVNGWLRLLPASGAPAPSSWENYARVVKEWAEFLAEHGVGLFDSRDRLKAGLSRYSYASCTSGDGSVTIFVSDVSGIGSNSVAIQLTDQSLQPLAKFGCAITEAAPNQSPPASQRTSQPQPAPPMPAWTPASPAPASAQPSLRDADTQGFLNYPGARCNYSNPAVAIARTAQSVVVICQTGVGRFYYRGFGLRNGLSVEIDDPVRNGAGFVATNKGVHYSLSPDALTITQGSDILSNEPMLEYWSQ